MNVLEAILLSHQHSVPFSILEIDVLPPIVKYAPMKKIS